MFVKTKRVEERRGTGDTGPFSTSSPPNFYECSSNLVEASNNGIAHLYVAKLLEMRILPDLS